MKIRFHYMDTRIYRKISDVGKEKSEQKLLKQLLSSILAGCFISFGMSCSLIVGGNIPKSDSGIQRFLSGIYGLPFGLLMIVLFNAHLFTGNLGYYTCSLRGCLEIRY